METNKQQEIFIQKAKIKFPNYDYSQVNYVNAKTPIKLFCENNHEIFLSPNYILNTFTGCPKCNKKLRVNSKESFIKISKQIHQNPDGTPKYDYSKVIYKTQRDKVKIICLTCGYEFEQLPMSHIRGSGCRKCSGNLRKTRDEIISEFQLTHGLKYDYTHVEYKNLHEKVCIICPEHGEFWQAPIEHIKGAGCPFCAGRKHTTETWINKANKVHGIGRYDYSKVEYKGAKENVLIHCNKCGNDFWQLAQNHIDHAMGCPVCADERRLSHSESNSEIEIKEYIKSIIPDEIIQKGKGLLKINNYKQDIDIWIPNRKIGIEFNGLYWHSEA